jgi:MFS family permease
MATVNTSATTNRTPVFALLIGNTISLVGNSLTAIALPWFALETTGSAAKTGLVASFVALPAILAGVFGGTLVDRVGFKRTSVISDIVSGLGVALIPLLYSTVGLPFWQLLALVFLGALLDIPGMTARRSLLPELADLGRIKLERVNAAFESITNLSLLLGPPIAGILIGFVGASQVLWIDTATFVVSATLVAVAIPSSIVAGRGAATGRYVSEMLAGFRFLRRDSVLLALAVSLGLTNMLGAPFYSVMLPVFAERTYGDATYLGVLVGASGAGAFLGATVYGWFGHRFPRRTVWLTAFLLSPVEFWIVAIHPPLAVILAVFVFAGIWIGGVNPLLVTVRHERIPPALRGRIFSTFSAIATIATPIGTFIGGNLIAGIGLTPAIIAFAVLSQLAGIIMFFVPAFYHLEEHRGEHPA